MAASRRPRNAVPLVGAFDLNSYRHPKGYVRVSTDEQAEEGTSIETQIQQLKSYAAAFGCSLSDADMYVDDGWSGKDLDRPAMARLRADAAAGRVDCVLVTKLDRFSRSLRDTVNLCLGEWQDEAAPERRVILKSISEPFDTHTDFGRMVFGLLAMFAEFERRRIADRTWSGKTTRARAGRNAGHRPPYGFALVPAADGRASQFAVLPEEAVVIRRICDLYLAGFGDMQIARRLNEEGLRYRGGGLWQAQQVARILTNPMMAGLYAYGRKMTNPDGSVQRLPEEQWLFSDEPAVSQPIVPVETYDRLKRLRATRWSGGRRAGSPYLLSGLVRCGRCGSACGVKRSGPEGAYPYYRCLRRKQSGSLACTQPAIRADRLEAQVLGAVARVLGESGEALSSQLRESVARQRAGLERQQADLARQRQRLAELRKGYFRWLEDGQMRPEAVQERLDDLEAELGRLAETQAGVAERLRAISDRPGDGSALPPFASAWEALTPQERKRLVELLVSRVEVEGHQVIIGWSHRPIEVEFMAE